jgi:hypothetical protein
MHYHIPRGSRSVIGSNVQGLPASKLAGGQDFTSVINNMGCIFVYDPKEQDAGAALFWRARSDHGSDGPMIITPLSDKYSHLNRQYFQKSGQIGKIMTN